MELVQHPREVRVLHGHQDAQNLFLEAYNAGRLPHAWLITGPQGIGKATLAHRIARFLLSRVENDDAETGQGGLFGEEEAPKIDVTSLDVDLDSAAIQRAILGNHGGLFTLEVEQGGASKEIRVDDVRGLEHSLALSSAESSWRVVIIDSADEMNRNAANALLKSLEEPPERVVFLLVSHCPGRLLPTIRSRCRVLRLMPLQNEVEEVLISGGISPLDVGGADIQFAILAAQGAPGRALRLHHAQAESYYQKIVTLLQDLPSLQVRAVQKFSEEIAGDAVRWDVAMYMLRFLLYRTVLQAAAGGKNIKNIAKDNTELVTGEFALISQLLEHYSVEKISDIWEKTGTVTIQVSAVNMDKKLAFSTVISEFTA